jgi:hypothetical protein
MSAADQPADQAWPEHAAIARRAYELFEARQHAHGHDLDDWFRAETELASTRPAPARSPRSRKQA